MTETTTRPALIGPYGPAQIACLRSWRRLGLPVLFVHLGDRPLPLGQRVASRTVTLPSALAGTPAGAARLAAALREHGADGITCLSESLAGWLHRLHAAGTLPAAPWVAPPEALARLASKAVQTDMAAASGLPVLPTLAVTRDSVLPPEAFPLVLRPDDPATVAPGFKALLLHRPAELAEVLAGLRRLDRPLVAQRLIVGPNLVVHGARAAATGEVFALAAFRVDRKFEGVTLRMGATALDPALAEGCRRFAAAIGVTGCFHFEFIEDADGRPWFLEMNGRLGGTTGKVFALGYDEPRHLLAAFVPALGDDRLRLASGWATGKQALVKAALRRLQGRQDPLDYPLRSTAATLAETAAGLLAWREETWRPAWPVTTLAYLLDRLMPVRSIDRARPVAPLGKDPLP